MHLGHIGRRSASFLAVLAAGCGGPDAPSHFPVALPVVEMRYVAGQGAAAVAAVSVHADGRLERQGAATARIDAGRLVCPDGAELVRVEVDRVVFDGKVAGRFSSAGAFEIDEHFGSWTVTVRDDGLVAMTTRREGTTASSDLRWEGFRPGARRLAVLVTALLTPAFGGHWCGVRRPTRAQ